MASAEHAEFSGIGRFSRTNESGKERFDWVENAKAHLSSSELEGYQYGAAIWKLLYGEAKQAIRHLDFDTEVKKKMGAEKIIFDCLEERFPDLEEPDQRTEAMTELITFKPSTDEKPGALAGRDRRARRALVVGGDIQTIAHGDRECLETFPQTTTGTKGAL